ncbi:MAG: transporter, substrate binding protein, partial [Devosia sp.]|nr:transporter, substrate binding protein [Devosia sp.]
MSEFRLNRRMFGMLAAGAAASSLLPSMARASGGLVAATFPGSWEDAYRSVLTPLVKAAGYDLTVAPALSQDQLTKVMASPGAPAFDTLLISPGQMAIAIENDLIVKIDPTRLKNWSKLAPAFQGEYGPTVTVQIDGIVYNPDVVPKPKGYRDL